MKTRLNYLFLLAIIFLTPNLVHAASACSYEEQAELNNIVANVKATYEVVDVYAGKVYDIDKRDEFGNAPQVDHYIKAFNIDIMNITDDIYVKVINNYDSEIREFRNNNTNNGTATFQTTNTENLITYTIEVYANKYACIGEKFRVLYITTPMYNLYSEEPECQNNKGFYYCQEFLPSENITFNDFQKKIKEYEENNKFGDKKEEQEDKNKSFIKRIKEFYNNHTIVINIVISIIIVAGVVATVILIKQRRSRVL